MGLICNSDDKSPFELPRYRKTLEINFNASRYSRMPLRFHLQGSWMNASYNWASLFSRRSSSNKQDVDENHTFHVSIIDLQSSWRHWWGNYSDAWARDLYMLYFERQGLQHRLTVQNLPYSRLFKRYMEIEKVLWIQYFPKDSSWTEASINLVEGTF